MRIIMLAILVLCIVYIGYQIKAYFAYRIAYFDDLKMLCNRLLQNLDFRKDKLSIFFDKHLGDLKCERDIMDAMNLSHIRNFYLKDNERNMVYDFVQGLGTMDIIGEQASITNMRDEIENISKSCKARYDKYGTLSFKLSIILALLLIILFI